MWNHLVPLRVFVGLTLSSNNSKKKTCFFNPFIFHRYMRATHRTYEVSNLNLRAAPRHFPIFYTLNLWHTISLCEFSINASEFTWRSFTHDVQRKYTYRGKKWHDWMISKMNCVICRVIRTRIVPRERHATNKNDKVTLIKYAVSTNLLNAGYLYILQ